MYSEKKDKAEELRQALIKILDWINFGMPEDPEHNCGNPDSGCDSLCSDWAAFCTDYTHARSLVERATAAPTRSEDNVVQFGKRYAGTPEVLDEDYEEETPQQREAKVKALRERVVRYTDLIAQLEGEPGTLGKMISLPDQVNRVCAISNGVKSSWRSPLQT